MSAPLTGKRVKRLILEATGDVEQAEKAEAQFVIEQFRKTNEQAT